MSKHSEEMLHLQSSLKVSFLCFPLTILQMLQNAQCDRMVREAETELLSSRIMLNLCRLLEAGCERTSGTSDIN